MAVELSVDGLSKEPMPSWTLMTSHGLVLLYVAANPDATIREIAESLELTDRRVNDIVRDLSAAGLVAVHRDGRRNHYALSESASFRHPFVSDISFHWFVSLWKQARAARQRRQPSSSWITEG
jgi:hypothetical protein